MSEDLGDCMCAYTPTKRLGHVTFDLSYAFEQALHLTPDDAGCLHPNVKAREYGWP